MDNANAKRKVKLFRKEIADASLPSLLAAVEKQGYTLIEFTGEGGNDSNVEALIAALGLSEQIAHTKAFTYADSNCRLVFLREELSEAEKTVVLAHELGHICCGHLSSAPTLGRDVTEEYEANEFAHYLLHPGFFSLLSAGLKKHKKPVIAGVAVLCLLIVGIVLLTAPKKPAFGEYYLTATGNKYHEADCIYVKNKTNARQMTEEEFESGEYEPCQTCLP